MVLSESTVPFQRRGLFMVLLYRPNGRFFICTLYLCFIFHGYWIIGRPPFPRGVCIYRPFLTQNGFISQKFVYIFFCPKSQYQ